MSSKDRLAALRQAREKGGRLQQWKVCSLELGYKGKANNRSQKRGTYMMR
jgi:hypothetical protein